MMRFKLLNKPEIKLFLTFLIIYAFFIHWTGWNEESRLALTRAIVEETRLEIDTFANTTGDRAYYNGHYYSDKPPGTSILGTSIYSFVQFFYDNFLKIPEEKPIYIPEKIFKTTYLLVSPEQKILVTQVLLNILFSALPGALLIILLYKTLLLFTKNESASLIIALIFGAGTLILPFSTVFFGNIIPALLSFVAFYLILRKEKERKYDLILAGFLSGMSILFDYSYIIILSGLSLFVFLTREKKELTKFAFFAFLGFLPHLIYNFSAFNNPFVFALFYIDSSLYPCLIELYEACPKVTANYFEIGVKSILSIIPQILFFSYRGLFFYYPVLLFSLLGLYYLYKQYKKLSLVIILLFLGFIIYNSILGTWYGGSSFGPRYLFPIIPFLAIPIIFVFEKVRKNKLLFSIFILLVAISVFHNILSLSNAWEEFFLIYEKYYQKLFSLGSFGNPLYEHYFPSFLDNGPESRLLDRLLNKRVDIRDVRAVTSSLVEKRIPITFYPFGILTLNPAIIPFVLVALIWLKDILKLPVFTKTIILFSLIFIFLLVFVRITDIFYEKNWYPPEQLNNATVRWMPQDGVLLLHSYKDTFANISMNSFNESRILDVYLDNNFIDSFNIPQDQIFIPIHTGTNKLRFHAKEGCDYTKNITDPRCLSFMVVNVSTTNVDKLINENKTLIYVKNWYPQEIIGNVILRWMSDNATIYMFVEKQGIYNLNMTLLQIDKNTRVDILLNDQLLSNFSFNKEFLLIPSVYLTKGGHVLHFDSLYGCKIPPNDIRCLSVAVVNIGLNPFDDMLSQITVYKDGWYDFEKDEEGLFIWSNGSSEIEIFNSKDTFVRLNLTASSYHHNRKVDLLVNDKKTITLEVPTSSSNFVTHKIELKSGRNVIGFSDPSGCDLPFQIEDSDDERCLSVRFRKISFV